MATPLTILYVDDDDDIREIAKMSLELDDDIVFYGASSGEAALQLLISGIRPSIIVTDVMMPHMDGRAFARQVRSMEVLADIPVIFMTAKARDDDIKSYWEDGISGVILKPFDPITLADKIRKIFAR